MKNIYVLSFTKAFNTTKEELTAALQELTFRSPMSTELSTIGFYGSLGKDSDLVTQSGDNLLLCVRKEEKVLPKDHIQKLIDQKVAAWVLDGGSEPTSRELKQIKEDVIFDLMPDMFTKTKDIHAYINPKLNTIVIDSSSRGAAEELIALLRKALGSLPVTSIIPDVSMGEMSTSWLNSLNTDRELGYELGIVFTFGREAHFTSFGDEPSIAIVKNKDLAGTEVKAHLDADQYVTKIELEYKDSITFMLHDDLSVKRIRFAPEFFSENGDYEDEQDRKLADFRLMSDELNNMITDLHNEFGASAIDSLEG